MTRNRSTRFALILAAASVLGCGGRPKPAAPVGPDAPGAQRRWTLSLDVALQQPGGKAPVQFVLQGDWVRTVDAVRDGERDVSLSIENATISGAGVPSVPPEEMAKLRDRLARRFWTTYRADGAALRVHFPREMDPTDRNLLQMVVTETQLVRGAPEQNAWTAVERDGGGLYVASYLRSGPRVEKRKLKYLDADGAAGATARTVRVDVAASSHQFTLDANGDLDAAQGTDRLAVDFGLGGGQSLTFTTATRLSNPRTASAPELAGALARARGAVDSAPIRSHAPDPAIVRAQQDRALLEGWTPEPLLAAAGEGKRDPDLARRLAALFRSRPETIGPGVTLARERPGAKVVLDALGDAGTPAAVDALARLAHDRAAPVGRRVDALAALVFLQRPTPEAMRIPVDLLDDGDVELRRAARLMAGALSRAARGANPEGAASLEAALASRLAKADAPGERVDLLAGLGNAAGPTALAAARGALSDARAEVRAAAVEALRLCEDPSVDGLISGVIEGDREPRVRASGVFAAGFRPPGALLRALQRAALRDEVEFVRSGAVTLLRKHLDEAPEVGETLGRVAQSDPKPGVRRLAREALDAQAAKRRAPGQGAR